MVGVWWNAFASPLPMAERNRCGSASIWKAGPIFARVKGSSHSPWIGRSQPDPLTCRLLGRGFEPEHFLQEPRRRDLVFAIGALFGGVLGIGEGVLGTAEELQLEAHFGGSQLLDQGTDLGERRDRVFGAMENQHTALDVLGGLRRE